MDVVVEEVVVNELTKVVEQVKEFNEALLKVFLCNVKQIRLEVVIDVVVEEVVDKEVTKVNELVKEVNEGLILVCRCGDHKVDAGHRDDVVLDKGADVEVNQELDKEVMVTTYWRNATCILN